MTEINIYDFCTTEHQKKVYETYLLKEKNKAATGRELNLAESTVREIIKKVESRAAEQGYAPDTYPNLPHGGFVTPAGFTSPFATVQYGPNGEVERIWPRFKKEIDDHTKYVIDALQTFYDSYKDNIIVLDEKFNGKLLDDDIIPWIQIGDGHIGMLAHARESLQNFDIKIAERELCKGIDMLLDQAGEHERGVINDLGDFTHYENMRGMTEASGNPLDYDTRFPKMIDSVLRIFHFIVDKALTKFKHVDIICNQGNHSRTNDFWMARHLKLYYDIAAPGRVTVLNNDSVFIPYRMGNTFVMVHHSDKCKPKNLMNVMTTDFRKHFGETENHYIDIGHIHHNMQLKEHPGVIIESFNNLANNDKWHHEAGYRSRQSVTCVFRSKEYGDMGRIVLPIRKIRDRLFKDNGIPLPGDIEVHTV